MSKSYHCEVCWYASTKHSVLQERRTFGFDIGIEDDEDPVPFAVSQAKDEIVAICRHTSLDKPVFGGLEIVPIGKSIFVPLEKWKELNAFMKKELEYTRTLIMEGHLTNDMGRVNYAPHPDHRKSEKNDIS